MPVSEIVRDGITIGSIWRLMPDAAHPLKLVVLCHDTAARENNSTAPKVNPPQARARTGRTSIIQRPNRQRRILVRFCLARRNLEKGLIRRILQNLPRTTLDIRRISSVDASHLTTCACTCIKAFGVETPLHALDYTLQHLMVLHYRLETSAAPPPCHADLVLPGEKKRKKECSIWQLREDLAQVKVLDVLVAILPFAPLSGREAATTSPIISTYPDELGAASHAHARQTALVEGHFAEAPAISCVQPPLGSIRRATALVVAYLTRMIDTAPFVLLGGFAPAVCRGWREGRRQRWEWWHRRRQSWRRLLRGRWQ